MLCDVVGEDVASAVRCEEAAGGVDRDAEAGEAGVPEVPEHVHDVEAMKPIRTQLVVRRSGGVGCVVLVARRSAGSSAP